MKRKHQELKQIEVFIIDEMSMLASKYLAFIDITLQHVHNRFDRPFGGKLVFLLGDVFQICPVEGAYFFNSALVKPSYLLDPSILKFQEDLKNKIVATLKNKHKQQQVYVINQSTSNSHQSYLSESIINGKIANNISNTIDNIKLISSNEDKQEKILKRRNNKRRMDSMNINSNNISFSITNHNEAQYISNTFLYSGFASKEDDLYAKFLLYLRTGALKKLSRESMIKC